MRFLFASLVVSSAVASTATADLVDPVVPTWRGEANSQYYQWDSFSAASFEPNFPTAPPFEFSAQLFNFAGGASIVDGNIVGAGGLNIHVYGGGTPTSDVVLNVTYVSFDPTPTQTDFFVGGAGPGAAGEYFDFVDSTRTTFDSIGGGQFRVTDAYTFDLSTYAGAAENWAAFFKIDGPNTLEGVSIDVRNVVPTPGVLATLALAGLGRRRRRC